MNVFLKDLNFLPIFVITAAGVAPFGGPKMYPRTPPIVQIMFGDDILRTQK